MARTIRVWAGGMAACAAIALCGASASPARESVVHVALTARPTTAPIADDFLGLAFEYSGLTQWVASRGPVNPVLVQLIRNLNPLGRPSIRIGGLSTDRTWWPGGGVAMPRGVTYALSPAWASAARSLAEALDARLVLGINLEADSLPLDRYEAAELISRIGRRWISAMDIGNEPPLYTSVPWYRLQGGTVLPWYSDEGQPVLSRDSTWGPLSFTDEFSQVVGVLPPGVPIAGPDTQNPDYFATWSRLLSQGSRVRMVMSHGYGLNSCVTEPGDPVYPTVPHLLGPIATLDLLAGLEPYVSLAHQDGAAFRIDEMGTVTCNGKVGVANTMASALWTANALFTVARAQVDGVNLHSFPNLSNALFDFSESRGAWTGVVHPEYYGALLFAQAAPAGSRLDADSSSGASTMRAWTTRGPGRQVHVLLINESLTDAQAVRVRAVPGSRPGPAALERLSASSAYATGGITLGGRSFGATTTTGVLPAAVPATAMPHAGAFRVGLPAASALLLTYDVARPGVRR